MATTKAPAWVFRTLPANAATDAKLHAKLEKLAESPLENLDKIGEALSAVRDFHEYDTAVNYVTALLWPKLEEFFTSDAIEARLGLASFAAQHLNERTQARVFRRLAKDPSYRVRRRVKDLVKKAHIREVALPSGEEGDWDPTGWSHGFRSEPLARHEQGKRAQEKSGVPIIPHNAKLRELLGIRSEKQLGFFLLATDANNGPYTKFTIPKKDGSDRDICAPKKQLMWVQRQILDKILSKVPAHEAAHGFVPGRSTVTNAAPHQGAKVLLKFDLTDFFPTIHYYRVVGLFTSLGYTVGDVLFSSKDDSTQVAPTLARLCCYTPEAHSWGTAVMPQGAPTSPAISNLVCRRLDARLAGLAEANKGVYTRYADDLTFSFKTKEFSIGRFRWWVDQICHQEGFLVNQKKFRVIQASQQQRVTGIVVNDELRVPRDARRRFRAILHNCVKNGVEAEAKKFKHPRFKAYLRGFASYIHMVHPEEGKELLEQVNTLLGPETAEGSEEGGE